MNPIFIEVTFAQLCIPLILPEHIQNQPQLFHMFFLILRISASIIEENENKLVQVPTENIIPKAPKHSWCICEEQIPFA